MNLRRIPFKTPGQFFKDHISTEGAAIIQPFHEETAPSQCIFSIVRIEQFFKFVNFPIAPFRSTVYEFTYISKGEMIRSDAYNQYIVGAGQIYFYKAENIKSVQSCSEDAEGYFCFFDKDYILQLLKNKHSLDDLPFFKENGNPLISLSSGDCDMVLNLLRNLEEEFQNHYMERKPMIGLLLCQLLLKVKRLAAATREKKIYTAPEILTQRFMDCVRVHALSQKSAKFYAAKLYVTPNHLNKCVKDCTGKPVSLHIIDMVIMEAKAHLQQKPNNITEISSTLGFQNVSYFTRVFKKHVGYSPKDYREKIVYPRFT